MKDSLCATEPTVRERFRIARFIFPDLQEKAIGKIFAVRSSPEGTLGAAAFLHKQKYNAELQKSSCRLQWKIMDRRLTRPALAAILQAARDWQDSEGIEQLVTAPVWKNQPEEDVLASGGYQIIRCLQEAEYIMDEKRASLSLVEKLQRLGHIPADTTVVPYDREHFELVRRLVCPIGLVSEERLLAATKYPLTGYDRQLSWVVIGKQGGLGCLLATVPEKETTRVEARVVKPGVSGAFNWVNAMLLAQFASACLLKNVSRVRLTYDSSAMAETHRLISRGLKGHVLHDCSQIWSRYRGRT